MLCKNCNAQMDDNAKFCNICGAPVAETAGQPIAAGYTEFSRTNREITAEDLPEHLRPLSPWAYFGLQLLYCIPVIGFIFLIIFSIKKSNINRRNFTRSYWCSLIIFAIIAAIVCVCVFILGASSGILSIIDL